MMGSMTVERFSNCAPVQVQGLIRMLCLRLTAQSNVFSPLSSESLEGSFLEREHGRESK